MDANSLGPHKPNQQLGDVLTFGVAEQCSHPQSNGEPCNPGNIMLRFYVGPKKRPQGWCKDSPRVMVGIPIATLGAATGIVRGFLPTVNNPAKRNRRGYFHVGNRAAAGTPGGSPQPGRNIPSGAFRSQAWVGRARPCGDKHTEDRNGYKTSQCPPDDQDGQSAVKVTIRRTIKVTRTR